MKNIKPTLFILDVDGVMTTGHFIYSKNGKEFKVFGPDDNDAISLLSPFIKIIFVTGDKKGLDISKKRIQDDMQQSLYLVSTIRRLDWIKENYPNESVIYMGDGIFDHYVMKHVDYAIAPKNADLNAKKYANYVCKRSGGERAVAEACLHILETFFQPFNPEKLPNSQIKVSGEWTI